jgi:hypothetical protein
LSLFFSQKFPIRAGMALVVGVSASYGVVLAQADSGSAQQPNVSSDEVPQKWEDYRSGEYLGKLTLLFKIHGFQPKHLQRMRFRGWAGAIGDLDLFRFSPKENCSGSDCYYVIHSSDIEVPVMTGCVFARHQLAHLHNSDGSKYRVLQFNCPSSILQIQISLKHFWISAQGRPS